MEDDIIRKVVNRSSCHGSQMVKSVKCTQYCSSRKGMHLPERTFFQPVMQSTPRRNKRKSLDEGYVTPSDFEIAANLTPIQNQKIRNINRSVSNKFKTLGYKRRDNIKKLKTFDNKCNEFSDSGVFKSPPSTQSRMLSLDDSVMEAIDVDTAVKDYWESCTDSNSKVRKLDPEEQGGSPDLFQGSDEDNDCTEKMEEYNQLQEPKLKNCDTVVKDFSSNVCDSHTHITENNKNKYNICVSETGVKNTTNNYGISIENKYENENIIQKAIEDINLDWDNDSLLNAVANERNTQIHDLASVIDRPVPLIEKIKRTLITNVQKPVTYKLNSVELNVDNLQQSDENKGFFDVGPFFGLPLRVKSIIQKLKGINDLYSWQKECLSLDAVKEKKNLIYALPTSGGKTLVAEILMLRELICYKKNAVFILPYVSIVQEKVRSLAPFGLEFDFFVEEYAAGKGQYPPRKRRSKQTIYVATIEKALGLINSLIELKRLEEIGLVVVDEIHLIGDDSGRGATLEGLLAKLLYVQINVQIVGMSATIGNEHEISRFLRAEIYKEEFRPVELKEYVKCEDKLYAVKNTSKPSDCSLFLEKKLSFSYSPEMTAIDPDFIGGLVSEVVPKDSCLVFCATKKNCENVAQLICNILPKCLLDHNHLKKKALYEALRSDGNGAVCPVLKRTIPFGIAYHHSGLTSDEKRLIEEAFQIGTLCCLCCTSTLAAGVNLPAKRVILRSPYIGRDFINLSRYKQMIGRAGRAGFGETGESILVIKPCESVKVERLLKSSMDNIISKMHLNQGSGLESLIISSVGLGIATTRKELQELGKCTLLYLQDLQSDVDLEIFIDRIICRLIKMKVLRIAETDQKTLDSSSINNNSNISVLLLESQEQETNEEQYKTTPKHKCKKILRLKNSSKLTVSRLGRAAIKGCIPLSKAHLLYQDLYQAQASLVLLSCLHLLYLVTPYDLVSQIKPNNTIYFSVFNHLNISELQAAKVIGITEVCMVRLMNGMNVQSVPERVIHRFYLTLILYDLWNQKPVWDVAKKYELPRGLVQTLMTSAAAFAASVMRFCEEIGEFWAFKDLLLNFSQQLSHCCTAELLPLMDLPAVKRGRAKQLFRAGYKTLQHVANAEPSDIVKSIDHMPRKVATQIIAAAKLLLKQKADSLREEAEEVLEGLQW